jgi:hypothetical protein
LNLDRSGTEKVQLKSAEFFPVFNACGRSSLDTNPDKTCMVGFVGKCRKAIGDREA